MAEEKKQITDFSPESQHIASKDGEPETVFAGAGGSGVSQMAEAVDVVRFSVPQYTGKLQTWFMRLEAQFRAGKVTSSMVKFNVVIAQAPDHMTDKLTEDEIEELSGERDCYARLKTLLLKRCTPSEDERLSTLFKDMATTSSERPSDVYRAINKEAKDLLPEETVKKLWLMRLPALLQMMLHKENTHSLSELLEIADQYFIKSKYGLTPLSIDAVSSTNPFLSEPSSSSSRVQSVSSSSADQIAALTQVVQDLKTEICALKRDNHGRGRSKSRQTSQRNFRPRSSTPGQKKAEKTFCWYHHKFGDRANDCREPCSWKSGN